MAEFSKLGTSMGERTVVASTCPSATCTGTVDTGEQWVAMRVISRASEKGISGFVNSASVMVRLRLFITLRSRTSSALVAGSQRFLLHDLIVLTTWLSR